VTRTYLADPQVPGDSCQCARVALFVDSSTDARVKRCCAACLETPSWVPIWVPAGLLQVPVVGLQQEMAGCQHQRQRWFHDLRHRQRAQYREVQAVRSARRMIREQRAAGPPHQAGRPSGPIAAVPLLLLPAQAPRPATPPRGAPPGSRPHPLLTSSTARHHRARVPPTSRTTNIPCHQHPHRRAAAWVRGGWRLGRRGFRRARWRRPSAADRAGLRARQVGCAGHL